MGDEKKWMSHIQLIKQQMKSFGYKYPTLGLVVDYWDIEKNIIKFEKVDNLGAIENYFTENTEKYLNKNIETKFNISKDKLIDAIKKNDTSFVAVSDIDNIRKFFQYSYIRNKEFYNKFKKDNPLIKLFTDFSPSDLLRFASAIDYQFENKSISIIINNSKNGHYFVCPHNVVYYIYDQSRNRYLSYITVNKRIIICLDMVDCSNHVKVIEVEQDELIDSINLATYLTEKNHENSFIVGFKDDLERLRKNAKKADDIGKDIVTIKSD